MHSKLILSVFVIFYIFTFFGKSSVTAAEDDNETFYDIQIYNIDRDCAILGGICVHKGDCAVPTTTTGLCPSNKHLGVECCYELPEKQGSTCQQNLGACMKYCNKKLQVPSSDCGNDICCVLVN